MSSCSKDYFSELWCRVEELPDDVKAHLFLFCPAIRATCISVKRCMDAVLKDGVCVSPRIETKREPSWPPSSLSGQLIISKKLKGFQHLIIRECLECPIVFGRTAGHWSVERCLGTFVTVRNVFPLCLFAPFMTDVELFGEVCNDENEPTLIVAISKPQRLTMACEMYRQSPPPLITFFTNVSLGKSTNVSTNMSVHTHPHSGVFVRSVRRTGPESAIVHVINADDSIVEVRFDGRRTIAESAGGEACEHSDSEEEVESSMNRMSRIQIREKWSDCSVSMKLGTYNGLSLVYYEYRNTTTILWANHEKKVD